MPKLPAGWNCKRCPVQEDNMKVAMSSGKEYKEGLKEHV